MPELPDVTVYVEALDARLRGTVLEKIRLQNPFILRSVDPPPVALEGRAYVGSERLGKRIVIELQGEYFLVIHLMIAGRLHLREPRKSDVFGLVFSNATVALSEISTKKRASLHLVQGRAALLAFDRGGIDVQSSTTAAFGAALQRENHTLKRSLTDPRFFSGIGNAYSDEILHRAKLSPTLLTQKLTPEQIAVLHTATRDVLREWTERLRAEVGSGWPEKVTAFRPDMAVHGKFGKPCPVCGSPIQRIIYAANEANYCVTCQTGGKLLRDRGLSRLLKDDWPKTLEQLEELKRA